MLTSRCIVQISGFIAYLVLGPGISMIPRIVRLDPGEAVLDSVSGIGSGELSLFSLGQECGCGGSWGKA